MFTALRPTQKKKGVGEMQLAMLAALVKFLLAKDLSEVAASAVPPLNPHGAHPTLFLLKWQHFKIELLHDLVLQFGTQLQSLASWKERHRFS